MRIGRAITLGTMAIGAWKAWQEYRDQHSGRGAAKRRRIRVRAR